jgi:hypothetical protein
MASAILPRYDDPVTLCQTPGMVVLVDNSNLWIEGQKVSAARQRLQQRQDPSFRINIGSVCKVVKDKRGPTALVKVYGSTPPPTDAVWKAMEGGDQHVIVDLSKRSSWTGKEKMVDNKIGGLVAYDVGALQTAARYGSDLIASRCYCIVSGDKDYLPSCRLALAAGIHVEMWSWRHALANSYTTLAGEYADGLFTARFLDDHFGEIHFAEDVFDIKRHRLISHPTIAFRPREPDRAEPDVVRMFREALPVGSYIYLNNVHADSDQTFFLILHYWPEEKNGFERLVELAKEAIKGTTYEALPIAEYFSSGRVGPDNLKVREVNGFGALEIDSDDDDSAAEVAEGDAGAAPTVGAGAVGAGAAPSSNGGDDGGDGGWSLVDTKPNYTKRIDQRTFCSTRRCYFREFCAEGVKCPNRHSEEERALFKQQPLGKGLRILKTRKCDSVTNGLECAAARLGETCKFCHLGESPVCKTCAEAPCVQTVSGGRVCCSNDYKRACLSKAQIFGLKKSGHLTNA